MQYTGNPTAFGSVALRKESVDRNVAAPCVLFAGGMLICLLMWCGLHITRAMHLRRLGLPRCGRCRYWATVQCPLYGRNTPDDFCSRGERWRD